MLCTSKDLHGFLAWFQNRLIQGFHPNSLLSFHLQYMISKQKILININHHIK